MLCLSSVGCVIFCRAASRCARPSPRELSRHPLWLVRADERGWSGPRINTLRQVGALPERKEARLRCRSRLCPRYAETRLQSEFSSCEIQVAGSAVCAGWAVWLSPAFCVLAQTRPNRVAQSGSLPYRGFRCPSPGCAGCSLPSCAVPARALAPVAQNGSSLLAAANKQQPRGKLPHSAPLPAAGPCLGGCSEHICSWQESCRPQAGLGEGGEPATGAARAASSAARPISCDFKAVAVCLCLRRSSCPL